MSSVKISNQYLEKINWQSSIECGFVTGNAVDIWRICVSSNLLFLKPFLAIMHPEEIERADRYFHLKDKNRHIVCRGALRVILGKYLNISPVLVEFGIGTNQKPFVKNSNTINIRYNISHSGDYILIAIANNDVGADIELINNDFDYQDIIGEHFNAEEIDFIKQDNSAERFFMLWTRKEALLKATAKGLDDDLKLVCSMDGTHPISGSTISTKNDWKINSFNLNPQYIASIAINPSVIASRYWDIDFNTINF
jgi:4'-phosphopantetheinyl transferase